MPVDARHLGLLMKPQQSELAQVIHAYRSGLLAIGAFSAFLNLLMLVSPLYMMQVYDRVLTSRSIDTLVALSVLAGSLLIVMAILEAIRSRVLVRLAGNLEIRYAQRIFAALFRANILAAGRATSQSLHDFDTARQFLSGPALIALLDAPWVPLLLGVIFLLHPVLGLVAVIGGILVLALALLNELSTRPSLQEANRHAMSLTKFVDGSLRNAEVVQGMGMYNNLERRWIERRDHVLGLQAIASDRAGTFKGISKASRILLQIAILGVGAYLAVYNQISAGAIIAASIVMGRALAPLDSAIGSWSHIVAARDAYQRLRVLLDEFPDEKPKTSLPAPKGNLVVKDLVAVPPGNSAAVLRKVSFAVPSGNILGIIGRSGAGKSTLARHIIGAWEPFAGSVRLDGVEISAWPRTELGPHLGYLPQDIELFEGTVSENIARFGQISSQHVVLAAQRARAHDVILHLPNGYDTEIGPSGSVLSGGQRQLIALARAFYGDPTLIVLDEPNSNLDDVGEATLVDALSEMRQLGSTIVVVTHGSFLLRVADLLMVLNQGTVQSFGSREEILEKYRRPRIVKTSGTATVRSG